MRIRSRYTLFINFFISLFLLCTVIFGLNKQKTFYSGKNADSFRQLSLSLENQIYDYFDSQQQICDSIASYISNNSLSVNEAIEFARSFDREGIMGHIVFVDNDLLSGLSTVAPKGNTDNLTVSYANISNLKDKELNEFSSKINLLKSYTNPINNQQSFGLCRKTTLITNDLKQDALFIRVIPTSNLFKDKNNNLQIALVDLDGNYYIKDSLFNGDNLYSFIENNTTNSNDLNNLKDNSYNNSFSIRLNDNDYLVNSVSERFSDQYALIVCSPSSRLHSQGFAYVLIAMILLLLLISVNYINALLFENKTKIISNEKTELSGKVERFLYFISRINNSGKIIGDKCLTYFEKDNNSTEELSDIASASKELLINIGDIQRFYDIESSYDEIELLPFSLVEIVRQLVAEAIDEVTSKDIDFNFYVNHLEHEVIISDRKRLYQIMRILLFDAIDRCNSNGVIEAELKEDLGESLDEIKLVFSVCDNNAEHKIVADVQKSTDSFNDKELQLTVAQKNIKSLRGSFDRRFVDELGTSVAFELNVKTKTERIEEMTIPSKRVLLVDSNKRILSTGQEALQSIGLIVDVANDTKKALKLIRNGMKEETNYDVVVVGECKDKQQLIDRVNTQKNKNKIKILSSSYSEVNNNFDGVDGQLSLPYFCSDLYREIASITAYDDYNQDIMLEGLNVLVIKKETREKEKICRFFKDNKISFKWIDNRKDAIDYFLNTSNICYSMIFVDNNIFDDDGVMFIQKAFDINLPITVISNTEDKLKSFVYINKPISLRRLKEVILTVVE